MKEKILIVDSDISILNILEFMLSQSHYTPIKCLTGRHAIDACEKDPEIKLCFMEEQDADIPTKDVLKEILKSYPKLPIILITGNKIEDSQKNSYSYGAYGIIYKPFDAEEILTITNQILRKKA
jgi:two-component system response regulator GlrR